MRQEDLLVVRDLAQVTERSATIPCTDGPLFKYDYKYGRIFKPHPPRIDVLGREVHDYCPAEERPGGEIGCWASHAVRLSCL